VNLLDRYRAWRRSCRASALHRARCQLRDLEHEQLWLRQAFRSNFIREGDVGLNIVVQENFANMARLQRRITRLESYQDA